MKHLEKRVLSFGFALLLATITIMGYCSPITSYAATSTTNVAGNYYQVGGKDNYNFTSSTGTAISSTNSFGQLQITGDFSSSTSNGITTYDVKRDQFVLSYSYDASKLAAGEFEWHLYDDKNKKIDYLTLDENMLKGALIVQTSLDGANWVTDMTATNIFADASKTTDFFTSKDIQLVNGCYYRIIVAYKMEIRLDDTTNFIGITQKNYDYKRCLEVYEFYAVNSTQKAESNISNSPRRTLGSKIEVKKDNGYDTEIAIGGKDPHYGWDIGNFFINGYTSETTNNQGDYVFLKNLGDKVTLWFNLSQDINCLNGNSNYVIAEDKKGYDHYFETSPTNFKHGALIIRYTDYEGIQHDPIIYTDFLAANATTGADTRVVLFEEGDYEVALDYKVCDKAGIDSYTDYRIFFRFSIRNSNCMVYPFDIRTNSELSDGNITANGFRLDMAKSRYLTVTVTQSALRNGTGGRTTDVRFNGAAKDGEEYTEEGIYTFDVENLYTGQHTVKTIYVGTDPFLKAMSVTGLSIREIEAKLDDGYTINDNGTLEAPVIPEPVEEEEEEEIVEEVVSENVVTVEDTTDTVEESTSSNEISTSENMVYDTEVVSDNESDEEVVVEKGGNNTNIILVVLLICTAGVAGYFIAKNKPVIRNTDNKENSNIEQKKDNTNENPAEDESVTKDDDNTQQEEKKEDDE